MDPEFSFPNSISIHLAPPTTGQQKSRAKSMSDDPPLRRKPFHAHRRSAAVSEDLGKMPFTLSPSINATSPEDAPGVPEDRKVAFVDPPCSIPQLSPTSANSTLSPRSPRRSSPRRRTMSSFLTPDDTPCIDLDEALYSKTLHRRTESLPSGLRSPFAPPPRIIEPLKEEDEHREREQEKIPRGSPTPEPRHSNESEASGESMGSELNKERKKRFSFFRPSSPRRSSSPRAPSPHKLRDPPSVSSLGIPIPDAVQRDLALPASAPASVYSTNDNFPLGEPGPVNPPSPERRNRKNIIPSWVYRRKELKYL